MDILVVVLVDLLFLFSVPASEWLLQVAVGILAANHESDLTRWVGWNSGVSIFNIWENLLAVSLELGDQWEVKPLVFS